MPYYKYIAENSEGKKIKGVIQASEESEVVQKLREEGLVLLDLKETKKGIVKNIVRGKIKLEDLASFSRQLATILQSGIPLVEGLGILSQQVTNPAFKKIISNIQKEIKEGLAFSDSLKKYPNVFSELYINMVKAGEASGLLDEILDRLASYLERTVQLQHKIKSSLMYPIVVVLMAIGITAFLMVKVIPTFKEIFEMLEAKLPLPTRILIKISEFFKNSFIFILMGLGIGVFIFLQGLKNPKFKKIVDANVLRIPVFGDLCKKIAIAKFSRTLATLIKSGVSILQSLEIVAKTSGNKIIEEAVLKARESIKEGEFLAAPLEKTQIFPPLVVRMIAVGEKTGKLEFMLSKIADFYDEEVSTTVSNLMSLIEPLIIGFLGIVIGGIVVSLFLPILKITQLVGR